MKVKVPPIKCQGIKTKLVPIIKNIMEWDNEGKWIEPFVGSGVVGFNVLPKQALLSDNNPHIIKFYSAIKAGEITPEKARGFLEENGEKLLSQGADFYYLVRERFNEEGNPLDFLFLNRSCFNGMIRFNGDGKFNVPFGHIPNRFAPAYITKIVNQIAYVQDAIRLNEWEFFCQDFEAALKLAGENDFIYCDPPYIGRHVDYYNSWDNEHEVKLHRILSDTPARFILSTWHSNQHRENLYIDSHWSDFFIVTKEHFYHVGASEENRKPMLEALVTNYKPETVIDESLPVQLKLFERKEEYSVA
ncbi:MAG: Dam family site-specific DNA-(adenine-N6)-methyltransferase [Chloroflexi bacterium]|nr:Dam family site-specific DNA-(adenine-N6)-methyltransferase [Chloroflexota bacterium]